MCVTQRLNNRTVRIGSRASSLAIAQTKIVADILKKAYPEIEVEIVPMQTTGDRILSKSLEEIGGKGLFILELNQALAEGRIDLAVHSLKDMPMDELEFPILAYSKREDPRDVLVLREDIGELPESPIIGSSSKRRRLQFLKLCEKTKFCLIRGNVQTRIRKLSEEQMDGTILAAAGLKRVNMEHLITRYFEVDEMIPSAGQGILAVQGKDTVWNRALAACVNDENAMAEAIAERAFVRTLDGGCTSPVAAHAQIVNADNCRDENRNVCTGRRLLLCGLYYREDGTWFVDTCEGDASHAELLGVKLAEKMRKESADQGEDDE
ncbi:MAG: hydroxymethylbilane synthase [Eubacteriales bacterium]|nr:hydroxymethylbilane synthase [Eubacteriales bacterium]